MNEETIIETPVKKINVGKLVTAAIVITIVGMVIGFLACGWLFNWIYGIEPTNVWKYGPNQAPSGKDITISFIGELILSLILVFVYAVLYKGISYEGWKKGVKFGFLVWLVSILPGMFATYMWMNVAMAYVVYMTIMGLIVLLVKGAIIGAIYKE